MKVARAVFSAVLLASGAMAQVQQPPDLRMAADDPRAVQAQQRLKEGQRLMAEDDFEAAAKAFEEAAGLDPLLMMAHYGLGTARVGRKEYAAAVTAFEAARKAFHERAELNAERRFQSEGAREERIRRLKDLIRSTTDFGTGSAAARQRTLEKQEWEAEVATLEAQQEAGHRPPQVPPGLTLALGSAYFRTGRVADAEREYRAAIEAQPKLGEARVNLAVVLLMTGRAADAKEQVALAKKAKAKVPPGLEKDIDAAIAAKAP
jgi:tetratricopeptide (TPR) repeat protein